MAERNRNPEQRARDTIDAKLEEAGWRVQSKNRIDFNAGPGIAVREYQTDVGPADYLLFIDRKPVGVIEAKPEDWGQKITTIEEQSTGYADADLKWLNSAEPRPFVFESTGGITRFTDRRDPRPRSREVFSFHRPETMQEWLTQPASLRARLQGLPDLDPAGLRACQVHAVARLEASFKGNYPRALMQMATGSGKTYTAVTSIYRLLKHADAKRILFLVDTRNLGEQAEQEFMAYVPGDDNRKFTELYNVQRLTSSYVAQDSQVCISTIQRMYSLLKDQEMDEVAEEINPAEMVQSRQPMPVVYNPRIPPEFFDFIVIDECHRSIYDVWRQVLEYFDASLIGLTATPDSRTYGFFRKNVVSEYSHEQAVADGVNVGNEVYVIDTERTKRGGQIEAGRHVEKRERLTRRKRWDVQDDDYTYGANELDRAVVNPDQIRTVVRTFRDKLPEIFSGRGEVPKTLIFAKTDSHADDIIQTVREEFGQGNDFCKKVTYRTDEDPRSVLAQFRNDYHPRIAVTVDMISTGTDVKPLECLIFMRDVRSRTYFEQMKGRGTRTLEHDDLRKVTPSAATAKTHYVIVDAVGVTTSIKTASRALISKPTVALRDLAMGVMMGARDEDSMSSLAGRLARLDRQLDDAERQRIRDQAGGVDLTGIAGNLLEAIDPDRIDAKARLIDRTPQEDEPAPDAVDQARDALAADAARVFTGELIDVIDSIRRDKEQTIDHDSLDTVRRAEWEGDAQENAQALAQDFRDLRPHREISPDYLYLLVSEAQFRRDAERHMTGAVGQRRVPTSYLADQLVRLPPTAEQRRIVAKIEELLSELDNGVGMLKAAREQLGTYRQAVLKHAFEGKLTSIWREENTDKLETTEQVLSRIKRQRAARYDQQIRNWKSVVQAWQESQRSSKRPTKPKRPRDMAHASLSTIDGLPQLPYGWQWVRLDSIAEVSGGLTKHQKRHDLRHKMKYLRVANVYADKILIDDIREIGVTAEESRSVALEAGDLLIVEGNGSIEQIGRVAMWRGELPVCGHQNHLIRVRLATESDPRLVLHFLLSPVGRNLIVKEASSTSGLHTLSISKVGNLLVPVGSAAEESEVVFRIDAELSRIDKAVEAIDVQLAKATVLRQSILNRAFSGQLVAQNPSDEPASVLLDRISADRAQVTKRGMPRKTGKRRTPKTTV